MGANGTTGAPWDMTYQYYLLWDTINNNMRLPMGFPNGVRCYDIYRVQPCCLLLFKAVLKRVCTGRGARVCLRKIPWKTSHEIRCASHGTSKWPALYSSWHALCLPWDSMDFSLTLFRWLNFTSIGKWELHCTHTGLSVITGNRNPTKIPTGYVVLPVGRPLGCVVSTM